MCRPTYDAVTINISKRIIFISTRGSLKLHVPNIIACFDDDPSMEMYLQTTPSLARAWLTGLLDNLHFLVLRVVEEEVFIVRLLGGVRCQ